MMRYCCFVFFFLIIACFTLYGESFNFSNKEKIANVIITREKDSLHIVCSFTPCISFTPDKNALTNSRVARSLCTRALARYFKVTQEQSLVISGLFMEKQPVVQERVASFFFSILDVKSVKIVRKNTIPEGKKDGGNSPIVTFPKIQHPIFENKPEKFKTVSFPGNTNVELGTDAGQKENIKHENQVNAAKENPVIIKEDVSNSPQKTKQEVGAKRK